MRLAWALSALTAWAVPAAGQIGITISPSRVEAAVKPGAAFTETLSLQNRSPNALEVRIELVDFDVDEGNKVIEQPPGTGASTLVPYLRVSPLRAAVGPGQRAFFRVSASLPEGATQRRAMLFFVSTPQLGEREGTRVLVVPRLGVPIYLEDNAEKPARPEVLRAELGRVSEGDGIELRLDMRNPGGRNLKVLGTLRVREAASGFDEVYRLNEGAEPILPGKLRVWTPRFGPVPGGGLSARLQLTAGVETVHEAEFTLPPRP
ncbi:MAG: hypothetical protein AB1625_10645 [Acidobacteriota bacterium]